MSPDGIPLLSDPVSAARRRWWLGALIVIACGVSAWLSIRAPCGKFHYLNLAGVTAEGYQDPDAYYLIAGVSFFREPRTVWPSGHPGLTLQAVVGLAAEICHAFQGPEPPGGYYEFVLRHWIQILVFARILMALVTVGTVVLVYWLARRCVRREPWALVAAALYATSYPVLLYLNRLTPEPVVMLYSLASLGCLWEAAATAERSRRCLVFAACAGAAAAGACFEKFYNGFLLLPILAAVVAMEWRTFFGAGRKAPGIRVLGVALLGFLAAALLFMQKMDVPGLIAFWGSDWVNWVDAPSAEEMDLLPRITPGGSVRWGLSLVADLTTRFSLVSTNKHLVKGGVFLLCELPFVVLGCLGILAWRQGDAPTRRRLAACLLFGATAPVLAILRGAYTGTPYVFHYFYPLLAASAIWAAAGLESLLAHGGAPDARPTTRRPAILAGLIILLVHDSAIALYANMERGLIASYDNSARAYVTALRELPAGKRIAVNLKKRKNSRYSVFLNLYMIGISPEVPMVASFNGGRPIPCWQAADRVFCIANAVNPPPWPDDVAVVIANEIEPWNPPLPGAEHPAESDGVP